jgi:hypothetical protein
VDIQHIFTSEVGGGASTLGLCLTWANSKRNVPRDACPAQLASWAMSLSCLLPHFLQLGREFWTLSVGLPQDTLLHLGPVPLKGRDRDSDLTQQQHGGEGCWRDKASHLVNVRPPSSLQWLDVVPSYVNYKVPSGPCVFPKGWELRVPPTFSAVTLQ